MLELSDLARRIHGTLLSSDSKTTVSRIAPLEVAVKADLSFLPDQRYRARLSLCRASAVIVSSGTVPFCPIEPLIVGDVQIGCARASVFLPHVSRINNSAHRSAQAYEIVEPSAVISASATIGRATSIGAHTVVGPGCVIGDAVRVGSYCTLAANVTIQAAATLGNRVFVGANSSIGGEPFLYVRDQWKWLKLPSFGSVEIGDDVSIGSNVVLDRGALDDTKLMAGAKIDSHVHIGHGAIVGCDTAIAARTAVAGEVRIGNRCIIGGAVGIGEGVVIASDVRVTAMSMVTKSLREAGASYSSGWSARRSRQWWRQVSALTKGRD
ncbi:MAG: UDP-3-O-(3-hydroxymyristoyl)glucosamine N-acyltransferase [Gammaproteobacteria bacterium]